MASYKLQVTSYKLQVTCYTGSKSDGAVRSGFRFAEGDSPRDPVTAPERSVRMSPKRFEATTTSNRSGRRTSCPD